MPAGTYRYQTSGFTDVSGCASLHNSAGPVSTVTIYPLTAEHTQQQVIDTRNRSGDGSVIDITDLLGDQRVALTSMTITTYQTGAQHHIVFQPTTPVVTSEDGTARPYTLSSADGNTTSEVTPGAQSAHSSTVITTDGRTHHAIQSTGTTKTTTRGDLGGQTTTATATWTDATTGVALKIEARSNGTAGPCTITSDITQVR